MEKDKEELQKMYYEIQALDEQIKEMQRNLVSLDEQIVELNNNINALDDFKDTETGKSTYVMLAPGIFANAEIKNNKELLVNVGSNVAVKKTVDDTKELLRKRFDLVKQYRDKMLNQMQEASSRASSIEQEINKKIKEQE
jgi:prefoldin alpha subunit